MNTEEDFQRLDKERLRYILEMWDRQQRGPDTPPDEEDDEFPPYDI